MTKRMLIDATHKEETRVAITDGNRLAEYDYESHSRKPLKGSIFLAKVTRVEPSLQAAFVNFGGNRHGFLPFSEIHPDYFRIPVSDREALMAEQEALIKEHDEEEAREEQELEEHVGTPDAKDCEEDDNDAEDYAEDDGLGEAGGLESHQDDVVDGMAVIVSEDDEDETYEKVEDDAGDKKKTKAKPKARTKAKTKANANIVEEKVDAGEFSDFAEQDAGHNDAIEEDSDAETDDENDAEVGNAEDETDSKDAEKKDAHRRSSRGRGGRRRTSKRPSYGNRSVEVVGGDDIDQERRFRFNLRRKYKIQEVIKRGQIMLIQANKEERGNKGAAVGTYLSLPGRYCVLMPNSPRAGGVSRKIANQGDRARMREIVKSLEVPKGMSVIIRTAGVERTKVEIKRDLDYLMRLWDNIRELTLESSAPSLVYEEADLIKRAVRDLYSRDVEEIIVSGEEGFKTAKDFMKMMIPSHVKKVTQYTDLQLPLFNRYQIESQISEIGQPEVRLKAGGYLVINPTEALISIDVNSGKATKGRHIEETALKTNLEAADEVARQLRLRDLGGLVVIDFIDMEDRRNNAKVERRMKEALSGDRARVQVGRISSFGLMELSRQRLSPSLTEAQYEKCPKCSGVGIIPSADAMSITVLRAIEEEGIRSRASQVIVCVNNDVALYILNHKRQKLIDIEKRHNFEVLLRVDDKIPACEHRIEVSKPIEKDGETGENGDSDGDKIIVVEEKDVQDDVRNTESSPSFSSVRRRRGGRSRSRNNDSVENVQGEVKQISEDAVAPVEERSRKPRRTRKPRNKPTDNAKQEVAVEATKDDKSATKMDSNPRYSPKKEDAPVMEAPKQVAVEGSRAPAAKPESKTEAVKPVAEKPVPAAKKPVEKKDYEVVNQAPKEKKKGWWNRL